MEPSSIDLSFLSSLLSVIKRFLKSPSESIYSLCSGIKDTQMQTKIVLTMESIVDRFNTITFICRKTQRTFKNQNLIKKYVSEAFLLTYYMHFSIERNARDFLHYLMISRYPRDVVSMFKSFHEKLKSFSYEIALNGKSIEEKLSIRHSLPSFFVKKMIESYGLDKATKEIEIMASEEMKCYEFGRFRFPSFMYRNFKDNYEIIILNYIKNEKINESLKEADIHLLEPKNIPFSSLKGWIFRVSKSDKPKILKHKLYNQNKIIFQDFSSIVAVILLDMKPHQFIYDMCAAPTIKTDLINQLSFGSSTIIAADFSHSRLKDSFLALNPELNIHLICHDSSQPALRNHKRFDRILLDAPCSGSGTFASNPQAKMHQSNKFMNEMVTIQNRLLHALLRHSDENTIIVYSVCSLYKEEGEFQIKNFLEQSLHREQKRIRILPLDFHDTADIESCNDMISQGRLFPSAFLSSGFYICKFTVDIDGNLKIQ